MTNQGPLGGSKSKRKRRAITPPAQPGTISGGEIANARTLRQRREMLGTEMYPGRTGGGAGYYNEFLKNILQQHRVAGLVPTPYGPVSPEERARGVEAEAGRMLVAHEVAKTKPAPERPTRAEEATYIPAPPTSTTDFITDWRGSGEYERQFDQAHNYVPGNDAVGPGGQKLPYGAIGWDFNGEPYYGEGIKGWWKALTSKIFTPTAEEKPEYKPVVAPGVEIPAGYQRYTVPPPANIGAMFENANTWISNLGAKEGKPTAVTKVARAVPAFTSGLLQAAQAPAIKTKQLLSLAQEIVNPQGVRPKPGEYVNYYRGVAVLPPPMPWKDVKASFEGLALKKGTNLEAAWEAGRVLYSDALQNGLRAEYKRRYLAGENPTLLAQELANPLAEMAGELVFDPLNVVGAFGKMAKDAHFFATARAQFFNVLPEVAEVYPDIAKGLGAIEDLGDAASVKRITDLVNAQVKVSGQVASGLDDFAKDYKIWSLTASGKRAVTGRRAGEFFGWILANSKDGDEALDMAKAAYLMASGDVDKTATGLAMIRKFPNPRPFFARAGEEFGVLLREVAGDDPKKFLEAMETAQKGGLDEVLKFASNKVGAATDKMFPTVIEKLKAGEKVNPAVAFISRVDKFIRPKYDSVNSFFIGVYMGLSPGYAMRNLTQNSFTILVDEGPGALFSNPAKRIEQIKKMNGGVLPSGFHAFSMGTTGVEKAGVARSKWMFGTNFAEKAEGWGAAQAAGSGYVRAYYKTLKPGRALPDPQELIDAGLSQEGANRLWQYVMDEGDVGNGVARFIESLKLGYTDALDALDWIPQDTQKIIREFGLTDEVLDATRDVRKAGGSIDDALAKVKGLRSSLDDIAQRTAKEAPLVSDSATGADNVLAMAEAHANGEVTEALARNATYYTQANSLAMDSYKDALEQLVRENPNSPALANLDLQKMRTDFDFQAAGLKAEQQKRAATATAYRKLKNQGKLDIPKAWKELGFDGDVPEGLDAAGFMDKVWRDYFYAPVRKQWDEYRRGYVATLERLFQAVPPQDGRLLEQARKSNRLAELWENVLRHDEVRLPLIDALQRGDNKTAVNILAHQYGISSITEKGVPLDQKILNTVNKYLPDDVEKYDDLAKVNPDIAEQAFQKRMVVEAGFSDEEVAQMGSLVKQQAASLPIPYAGQAVTGPRLLAESKDGLNNLFDTLEQGIRDNWGKQIPVQPNPAIQKALSKYEKVARGRVAEARLMATAVGNAARDFALLAYPEKRYFDLALAYVFPFHFWYGRTYVNWMKRIAYNPEVLAAYAKYKNTLAAIHAGAPDWWKYNINSNELLGIDDDNPLFFNLEATLNPLNGLTGVDFNDPDKRVNWWTSVLDDLGKFGPSIWTPIALATAMGLQMQGEDDAASRWGGRLIPQTATLKSLLSLANVNIPTRAGVNEFDPAVQLFAGGMDPYERKRVGRVLGQMVEEGSVDRATAIDAAHTTSGTAWREATEKAIRQRAWGQISSFALGVGFKARNVTDIQIDQFDQQYRMLWALKPTMTTDEFQDRMEQLRNYYPWMDLVLLSRKSGVERDEAYSWNVLGRIPPGQSDSVAELVGMPYRLINEFYDSKGDSLKTWKQPDKDKFMAGMVEIGAILDLPPATTKYEWNMAKTDWKQAKDAIKDRFGGDIEERIAVFYNLKGGERYDYLDANPDVKNALEFQDYAFSTNPLLRQYYYSLDKLSRYWDGVMYDNIKRGLGGDIFDTWDTYFELQLVDAKKAKAFYKEHPELKLYGKYKDAYQALLAKSLADVEKDLKEPTYSLREGAELGTTGAQSLVGGLAEEDRGVYGLSSADFQKMMSPTLWNLTLDHVLEGEGLSNAAESQLEGVAGDLNISLELLLELIGRSIGP